MPKYDLDGLGAKEFERLAQTLLKVVIGNGTITFGEGPDGGREATFEGKAPYPSQTEQWSGHWIFQAKFHDVKQIGADKARQQVVQDLKSELEKIVLKYKHRCDNYILLTNVALTSVKETGTHDLINKVESGLKETNQAKNHVPAHIHVWGADEIDRFLEAYGEVRRAYLSFITPGDLIAELLDRVHGSRTNLSETIKMYMTTCFDREQYAQLDQAGQVSEEKILLRNVFVDLDVIFPRAHRFFNFLDSKEIILTEKNSFKKLNGKIRNYAFDLTSKVKRFEEDTSSAMNLFLSEEFKKIILIGGPGEGKSTLCQFLAQVHRSSLIGKAEEFSQNLGLSSTLTPLVTRIPFRVILKEYAQWITNSVKTEEDLENFLVFKIKERTTRTLSTEEVQSVFKNNPCLLILDGLDEVTSVSLQNKLFESINDFLVRCEKVLNSDLQIIATSRPTGYRPKLEELGFSHITLANMNKKRVLEYAERWKVAKLLEEEKAEFLLTTINECLDDPQIQPLTNTPLQVTILILIILTGGTPPRQREALFEEYLDIIYRREKTKGKWILQSEKALLFGLHKYLAYVLHASAAGKQNVRAAMTEKDFVKEVRNYLTFNDKYSTQKKFDQLVEQIVKEARERLVLIVELETNFFGFELRSIQEFFAAAHLADTANDTSQRYRRFEAIARPAHWRNVALLFAGRVGHSYGGEASNIVEICIEVDRVEPEIFLKTGAWLGLEIAADRCFVPNRNLQRSILEYSLSMLDDDFLGSKHNVTEAIKKLQKEDIKDHVKPILEEKMRKCRFEALDTIADIYYDLFNVTDKLLEQLNIYLQSAIQDQVNWAILKCLSYKIPANWFEDKFPQVISSLSSDTLAKFLVPHLFRDPIYVQKCLHKIKLNNEQIASISNLLISQTANYWYAPDKMPIIQSFDMSTNETQMWIEVTLARMLAYLYGRIMTSPRLFRHRRKTISMNELINQSKLFMEVSKKGICQIEKEIGSILKNELVSPHIRLYLWILNLSIIPYENNVLEEFITFYRKFIATNQTLNHSLYLWNSEVGYFCAFPSSLIVRLQEGETDTKQLVGILYNASKSGLKQLHEIKSRTIDLTDNEVVTTLNLIRGSLPNNQNSNIENLFDMSWKFSPEIINTLDKMMENLILEKGGELLLGLTIQKMLKMADFPLGISPSDEETEESRYSKQFYEIAKNFPENINIAGFSNLFYKVLGLIGKKKIVVKFETRSSSSSEVTAALFALAKSMDNNDYNIADGAAQIIGDLLPALARYSHVREEMLIRSLRKKLVFKTDFIKKKIVDEDKKVEAFIKMLILSNVSVSQNHPWLFSQIKSCSNSAEAVSWQFFIHNCEINDDLISLQRACKFLLEIVNERIIKNDIRKTALNRLNHIYQIAKQSDKFNEEELELPLNKRS